MTTSVLFVTTAAAIIAAGSVSAALAGDPLPRQDVAAAFHLHRGAHMPVIVGGTNYDAQYVRIEVRRGGEYAVIFRLSK